MAAPAGVLGALQALVQCNDETADGFLIAAIYFEAIREDVSPRTVAEGMFRALPTDAQWPHLRSALITMLHEGEA
jgi:hypothetical protein